MTEKEKTKFKKKEILEIIKNLKNNKAMGTDKIFTEQIRQGGEKLLKEITDLFNEILDTQKSQYHGNSQI